MDLDKTVANDVSASDAVGGNDPEHGDAVEALYRRQARIVAASIRRLFGNGPPDPDDVTQLAFQKLLEHAQPERIRNAEAFLWRTARNIVLNEKRSAGVAARHEADVADQFFAARGDNIDLQRVVLAKEELMLINTALRRMPAKRRRAFVLHRIDGLSVSDVGRQLGVSRSAAQKHIAKATALIDTLLSAADQGKTSYD
ncbi:MAG: sigma-70 family RNA polymerase sigma factor [Pseudomonadota bacterium]